MDGNKDAALKCMAIGRRALEDGDRARAYRFLSKAKRLDPNMPVDADLLSSLAKEINEQTVDDSASRSESKVDTDKNCDGEASSSDPRKKSCNGQHTAKATKDFTSDQAEVVRHIKKTKDYYQILGLNKDCTAEEVRKAYRKISLKVHPDKNKAPGAEEAFKRVSKAFACLSDEELRNKYDQYGPEETDEVAHQHFARRRHTNGYHNNDMFDADEIFNSFFFGTPFSSSGFQRAHFVRTQGTARGGAGAQTREVHFGGLLSLLQLLPIVALFLISYFPTSQPVYSLEQVAPYRLQQVTKEHGVPFFVKSEDFDRNYPLGSLSRRNIEAQVERDYREILGYNCRIELGRRHWNPSAARPNCDMLQRLQASS